MNGLVLFAVVFSLLALMLSLLAAWSFAQSPVKPRYKRSADCGVKSRPDADSSPFPNLLGK